MYFLSRRTHERSGKPPESALLLLKNANVTLSNATGTVASLLPVCLSIFGCSLLLNIQSDVPGDMSWLKMTGWVETVDNARAHTHTRRTHARAPAWLSEILVAQQGGCRESWSVVLRLQKCLQVKVQTAPEAHAWSAFCGETLCCLPDSLECMLLGKEHLNRTLNGNERVHCSCLMALPKL